MVVRSSDEQSLGLGGVSGREGKGGEGEGPGLLIGGGFRGEGARVWTRGDGRLAELRTRARLLPKEGDDPDEWALWFPMALFLFLISVRFFFSVFRFILYLLQKWFKTIQTNS
jgi:hypothetical protein